MNEFLHAVQYCKDNDPNIEGLEILDEFLGQEGMFFDITEAKKLLEEMIHCEFDTSIGTKQRDQIRTLILENNNQMTARQMLNGLFNAPPELW